MFQNRILKFKTFYTTKQFKSEISRYTKIVYDAVIEEFNKSGLNNLSEESKIFKEALDRIMLPRQRYSVRVKIWDLFDGDLDVESKQITYKENLFNFCFFWLFNVITLLMEFINTMMGREPLFKMKMNDDDVNNLPEEIREKFLKDLKGDNNII